MHSIQFRRFWSIVVAGLALIASSASGAEAETSEVFVLASLYSRHQAVAAYDLNALRRLMLAIRPDVVVVDCTPTEVRERKVHASKIEYPQVVFPLMREHGYRVYAAEPDEPLFTKIVEPLAQARAAYASAHPDAARALKDYEAASFAALNLHWRSAADVYDETTALVVAARKALDAAIYGEIQSRADRQWLEHWSEVVRRAATENPGKRIVAIIGLENRHEIDAILRNASGNLRVVDMEHWLRRAL